MSEDTGAAGGDAPSGYDIGDIDFSAFEPESTGPEVTEQPNQDTTPDGTQDKDNPKWAPFLQDIPEAFHPKVKEHLRTWDQGVNSRFQEIHQQYEPYKQFVENKVDPSALITGHRALQELQADPLKFYRDLEATLRQRGYTLEANQVAAQAEQAETASSVVDEDADDPYLQKIQELEQRIQERDRALFESVQEEQQRAQQQELTQHYHKQIDNDFAQIEQRIGQNLPEVVKNQILEKALIMGQNARQPVSIAEAAQEVFKFMGQARSGQRPAPNTIPTGGGNFAAVNKDPAEMNESERRAFAERIIQNQRG